MSKYIEDSEKNLLRKALALSVTKKLHNERAGSIAISSSGKLYSAGLVESDTNTFNLPSEHIALMLSSISNDYGVKRVITLLETQTEQNFISPIVLKIIKDHSIRTGVNIEYVLVDTDGKVLKQIDSIDDFVSFYNPKKILLSRTKQKPSSYWKFPGDEKRGAAEVLRAATLEGLNKNFPLYDSASGYACAVRAGSGKVYFAGQYSSPDKRLGLHSEVNAILAAIMAKEKEITHLGLVSTKYPDTPCHMCGNCRQFVTEISEKFAWNPKIYLFAKDSDKYIETSLEKYLPSSWKSKNWKR